MACLGDCEYAAPGQFCSGKLENKSAQWCVSSSWRNLPPSSPQNIPLTLTPSASLVRFKWTFWPKRTKSLKGILPVPLSQLFSILAMHQSNLGVVLKIPVPRPLSRPDKSDSGGWGQGCAGKSLITGFLEENTHVYICTEIYYKFYWCKWRIAYNLEMILKHTVLFTTEWSPVPWFSDNAFLAFVLIVSFSCFFFLFFWTLVSVVNLWLWFNCDVKKSDCKWMLGYHPDSATSSRVEFQHECMLIFRLH